MKSLNTLNSNRLGGFRTSHHFLHFASFESLEEFISLLGEARAKRLPVYILGKGSNTWFSRSKIHTAILKNDLPDFIEILSEDEHKINVRVSSATSLMKVMRFCEKRGYDCFYFLASVPGNIGGALAMNAGGPPKAATIFDFVDSITAYENGEVKIHNKSEVPVSHRSTNYTGIHPNLIVEARFTFPKKVHESSPVAKRMEWYKRHQDTSGPSLGSVFSECNGYILGAMKRLKFGVFGSHYSVKWSNWIVCRSGSIFGIRVCVQACVLLHKLFRKRLKIEIIEVK